MQDRNDLQISIYPKQQWVISLGILTNKIFDYKCHTLHATLKYTDIGKNTSKKPKYIEKSHVCFDDYGRFLIYISEIDELGKVLKDLNRNIKMTGEKIAKAYSIAPDSVKTTSYSNVEDKYNTTLVTEIPQNDVNVVPAQDEQRAIDSEAEYNEYRNKLRRERGLPEI